MRFLAACVAADAAALATQAGMRMLTVAPAPKAAETACSRPAPSIVPTVTP